MAAIIQTSTLDRATSSFRPSRPPRHLSAVAVPASGASARTVAAPGPAQTVADPAEPLFTPHAVVAMVATVVFAALLALGVGGGAFSFLAPTPGSQPIEASEGRVVVVEEGDSVWSIARGLQPEGDVRSLVHRIVQANGAAPLQPGQQIVVPG